LSYPKYLRAQIELMVVVYKVFKGSNSADGCRTQKGFPQSTTLDEILEFVEGYGKTEVVFMRRYNKTLFKVR